MEEQRIKMIAKTFEGFEEILARELRDLGAEDIDLIKRGIHFSGDKKLLYMANYNCRTALRILVPLSSFRASTDAMLYDGVRAIPWEKFLDFRGKFAIDSVISYSTFTHSGYVSLKAKDAIADRFRDKFGKRPDVDNNDPDLRVNVHIFREECTVSIDSSGASLHLRGYRRAQTEAPINEVLAAGLILMSGWDGKTPFLDPMCGSGTILIEAALIAGRVPPGYYRPLFGFERWKDFDRRLWDRVKRECEEAISEPTAPIIGYDRDEKAILASQANIDEAGVEQFVKVEQADFTTASPPWRSGFLLTNPPYGERIKVEDLKQFYKDIGDVLKQKYAGYTAWLLGSNEEAMKFIGLRPSRRIRVMNGPLECRLAKFELYEGRKGDKTLGR
ncbi:MAG: RNA methyltransferase [Bacteroidales bacterium]|nr:RNA methyltransferase [Bacteroidales bacterium]HPI85735.1 THUMP domain-containing protein [Bacteroidales bacterium]HPM92697.1 THUMP domain-containing protein [Bacteroidales bacterium]